ncbi:MAG: sulfatase-like hydrolase/transferase [Dysgonamonadaceae bacterium]|nr:sulfatase-like hydrolase/transferase [Dysgonamonadaceae bacterium]MDD4729578.1 sulfatase-like hydrolase/transferase [Dysgonamonadaceae bacterium]
MKKRLLFILYTFFAWVLVFAIQKPLFLLYHHKLAANHSFYEFSQVVLNGLKLDVTMAGYLTSIPLLLTLISIWFSGEKMHTVLKAYFAVIAIIVALIFTVDEALYGYWKFRLDSTIFFYLESPRNAMASVPILAFLLQFIKTVAFVVLIYWFFRRFIIPVLPKKPTVKKWQTLLTGIVLGGLLFIAMRGGVTTSTANVGMVYFSKDQFLNHAAINPCFSLLTSFSKQEDFSSQFQFFTEEKRQQLFSPLYPTSNITKTGNSNKLLKTNHPNILMIILEGISANVVESTGGEVGITPNLNKLSEEGILFSNMYANSFRTDRGLVSILNGYLAQPTASIMKYPAKSQTLPSIAKSLRNEGYETDVLYGGDINFTNMKSFFFNSGYNNLTSDVDFPVSSRLSKWGADDDVTFERLYDDILNKKEKRTSWFSTFLTLSSHEPFKVPYNRLKHPYLNSVAFTDSCLGDFVEKIKKTPAWDNLLIIFVSDHGYPYPETLKEYEPARYHIPCLWIGGAIKSPTVIDKQINQTDLAATLLAQLDINKQEFTFSRDIFSTDYPEFVFYTFNNGFGFIDSTGISVYDNTVEAPLIEKPKTNSNYRLNKGKAILQTLYQDLGGR